MGNSYSIKPLFHNCIFDKDGIWFWDITVNGLFFADKKNGQFEASLKCLYRDSDICDYEEQLFTKTVLWNKKLIMIPGLADELMIYDLFSGETDYIELPLKDELGGEKGKFWGYVLQNDILFLIGYFTPYVVEVDLRHMKSKRYVKLGKRNENPTVYFKNAVIKGADIIIPDCLTNRLFFVDTNSFGVSEKVFLKMNGGFSFVAQETETDRIWLSPRRRGAIISFDSKSGEETYFNAFPDGYDVPEGRATIGFIESYKDNVIFFPLIANKVLEIKSIDRKIIINDCLSKTLETDNKDFLHTQKVMCVERVDDCLYIYGGINRQWIIYDKEKETVKKIDMLFAENELERIRLQSIRKKIMSNDICIEEPGYSIEELLEIV